ncbi:unnamed protein product [Ceutorhynchus assimilis]|uniref:non-specific serine/threonine protein kinase n=1 Tax=Ceutorhynchus assimilis TaxID=467358 RepID=A0A9N9MGJ3_9CUCU|nr:unnamed protein product [Ceutorhynchus assimilis]
MAKVTAFSNNWLCYDTILGEGAYGEVKLLVNKNTEQKVACKIIEHYKHKDAKEKIKKEVMIHKMLDHENIIKYFGKRHEPEKGYIFLEYASGGELFNMIEPDVGMPPANAQYFMKHLLRGVNYLHQKGIAHRDIKPENLLIDGRGVLKISDFGLATIFMLDGKERTLCKPCGTKPYTAPEVRQKCYSARPADLWSCGIVLVAMLAGELPWVEALSTNEDFSRWCTDYCLTAAPWSKLGNTALSLIRQILNQDRQKRLTLKQILRHPWMKFDFGNDGDLKIESDGIPMNFTAAETNNYNREITEATISQPVMVTRSSCVDELVNEVASNKKKDVCFSEPTKIDDFILQLTQTPVEKSNFHNLVKRMTRFYVLCNRKEALDYLGSVLDGLRYSWALDCTGTMTICTVDFRKNPLVFKMNLFDMDGKILMDFRLSKGCGIEFKRKIIKLKSCLSNIIQKSEEHSSTTAFSTPSTTSSLQ